MGLRWTDTEDLAMELFHDMPDTDPLSVRFTELRNWVVSLPSFDDDPKASNEAKLEAIQMAWLDEYRGD